MLLTPGQRKLLEIYKVHRGQPPSFPSLLVKMLPMILPLAALVTFAYLFVSPSLALFAGGMSLGAILRQGSLAWRSVRVMPSLYEVIDWDKVDLLLRESELAR